MQISVAQFEEQSVRLLNRLEATHEEIVIVRDGKPMAKLVSLEAPPVSCLDLMREGIGSIENGPADLSRNPRHREGYGA